ncbi:MAG: acyl transferase [Bacteroidetes bacterium B1(2017)]|nr:MAG: acyl transferase [Bacteroidetes bacterium B1(2017)]
MNHLAERIFQSKVTNFDELCLEVFQFQFLHNTVYQTYCGLLGINAVEQVTSINQIPFLPIEFFKTHSIKAFVGPEQKIFYSSATGGNGQSKHYINNLSLYEQSFLQAFQAYFGSVKDKCFLGLLPSYLEREGSSLIYMVQHLMQESGNPLNGFFLYEHQTLYNRITQLENIGKPYFIFGVSFALLDFAQAFPMKLVHGQVIETGGMKGRKKEITKLELYKELSEAFETNTIFSEYGMTELLSQAYASMDGKYQTPPWMKVEVVDPNDPLSLVQNNKTGLLRIIDLANLYSCSFIQSSDLGKQHPNNTFEVLGRLDNSDLRGCSLLVN